MNCPLTDTTTRHAIAGWGGIALLVTAVDLYVIRTGRHTMSHTYRQAFQHHPRLVGGVTGYVIAHLTGALPARIDILTRIA